MSVKCTDCGADLPTSEQAEHILCHTCHDKRVIDANRITFITRVLCPVCKATVDEIAHGPGTPLSEIHALLAKYEVRQKHAAQSPDCAKHPLWTSFWSLKT